MDSVLILEKQQLDERGGRGREREPEQSRKHVVIGGEILMSSFRNKRVKKGK